MTDSNNKRYICSYVKKTDDGELKPNVVVITASNNIIARAMLCKKYGVVNQDIDSGYRDVYKEEGIKAIRLSETNTGMSVEEDEIKSHNS